MLMNYMMMEMIVIFCCIEKQSVQTMLVTSFFRKEINRFVNVNRHNRDSVLYRRRDTIFSILCVFNAHS